MQFITLDLKKPSKCVQSSILEHKTMFTPQQVGFPCTAIDKSLQERIRTQTVFYIGITVVWNVMLCSLESRHQHFGGICFLNLQNRKVNQVGKSDVIRKKKSATEVVFEAVGNSGPENDRFFYFLNLFFPLLLRLTLLPFLHTVKRAVINMITFNWFPHSPGTRHHFSLLHTTFSPLVSFFCHEDGSSSFSINVICLPNCIALHPKPPKLVIYIT